ncbi:MAG TPA: twin-arginine translocase TatA/TatE family subunit [Acidimicrobiales bacterium]|jgi:sec-independent protein translocase protein TatB
MLNFSPEKLLLVGLIALVVLGPHRLPQAARTLGRVVAELRRMSSSFQEEVRGALAEPTEALHAVVGDFRPTDVRRSVRDAITNTLAPPAPTPSTGGPAAPASPGGAAPGAPTDGPQTVAGPLLAPDDPSLN